MIAAAIHAMAAGPEQALRRQDGRLGSAGEANKRDHAALNRLNAHT